MQKFPSGTVLDRTKSLETIGDVLFDCPNPECRHRFRFHGTELHTINSLKNKCGRTIIWYTLKSSLSPDTGRRSESELILGPAADDGRMARLLVDRRVVRLRYGFGFVHPVACPTCRRLIKDSFFIPLTVTRSNSVEQNLGRFLLPPRAEVRYTGTIDGLEYKGDDGGTAKTGIEDAEEAAACEFGHCADRRKCKLRDGIAAVLDGIAAYRQSFKGAKLWLEVLPLLRKLEPRPADWCKHGKAYLVAGINHYAPDAPADEVAELLGMTAESVEKARTRSLFVRYPKLPDDWKALLMLRKQGDGRARDTALDALRAARGETFLERGYNAAAVWLLEGKYDDPQYIWRSESTTDDRRRCMCDRFFVDAVLEAACTSVETTDNAIRVFVREHIHAALELNRSMYMGPKLPYKERVAGDRVLSLNLHLDFGKGGGRFVAPAVAMELLHTPPSEAERRLPFRVVVGGGKGVLAMRIRVVLREMVRGSVKQKGPHFVFDEFPRVRENVRARDVLRKAAKLRR